MLFKKYFLTLLQTALSVSLLISCSADNPVATPKKVEANTDKVSSANVTSPKIVDVQPKVEKQFNDGPYIFNTPDNLQAFWLCNGNVEKLTVNNEFVENDNHKQSFNRCTTDVVVDRINFTEQSVLTFQGDFNVVATSDFHGQYGVMNTLLKNNRVIDENNHWAFGKGHFVITGDVFDRGDKVTEILWFLYRLEKEAELAGGKLHLLLGNHEVMVLNGDLRYLHPKYVEVAKKLNQPFEKLYGKGTVLGDWLRTKPVLVKINNMLFAHGGFHPSLAKEKRSLSAINQVFKANLVMDELASPREGWGEYLHKSNGPIWYRGYFKDNGASAQEIDLLLAHFDIDYLVVGHTSQKQVETRHQGKVIAIDSSIKKGRYGELLFVEGDKKWRGSLTGEKLPLH
ncbi:metallophosphoesterase [Colwellia sp. 1_MG-2023]|uniref:metallophosphoesterase n=1 Tax=Colwellia sp. 1_MG-2023 TaxID=3062649 RepID=UPI0026E30EB6|nr:metallophosphoesterase [Colwellia sp. 1_MG-2023]MDO6446361.1 metallophosphoesterase [Colwellia sp. 1_MG-2023]